MTFVDVYTSEGHYLGRTTTEVLAEAADLRDYLYGKLAAALADEPQPEPKSGSDPLQPVPPRPEPRPDPSKRKTKGRG